MKNPSKHMHYDLGQEICRKLRAGYRNTIMELYNRYALLFAAFARQRLFDKDPHGIESVLSKFWLELMNGKAICKYNGKASLHTYLTVILNRRIIDANRKFERKRKAEPVTHESDPNAQHHIQQTPETELMAKEQRKRIYCHPVRTPNDYRQGTYGLLERLS
jgi:RNA polymerase sigma-70 factor (ECF subfamily)